MRNLNFFLVITILICCSYFIFRMYPSYTKDTSTIVYSSNISNENNISSANDYSVLVQSPIYDVIVQLDKSTKEINVKLLDDSSIGCYDDTNKYINFTHEDITFLKDNANELLKEFKDSSMLDKYSFVSKMLEQYDTNIKMGDLISIAMSYLK